MRRTRNVFNTRTLIHGIIVALIVINSYRTSQGSVTHLERRERENMREREKRKRGMRRGQSE